MRGRESALMIAWTHTDWAAIDRCQRGTRAPAGLARRGRILLLLEQGKTWTDSVRTGAGDTRSGSC